MLVCISGGQPVAGIAKGELDVLRASCQLLSTAWMAPSMPAGKPAHKLKLPCRRGLIADQENQRLGPKTPPDFSDAHGTSSRLFV